jgi:hypothetical protein
MHEEDRHISASEIGTWCYCKKAWHLAQRGNQSSLAPERTAGLQYHAAHSQDLNGAIRQRAAARAVVAVCALVALIAFVWVWFPR